MVDASLRLEKNEFERIACHFSTLTGFRRPARFTLANLNRLAARGMPAIHFRIPSIFADTQFKRVTVDKPRRKKIRF